MGEYGIMKQFTDMSDFHQGYQFFILRPSRAGTMFIIVTACTVLTAVVWSFFAKMDDVVKATALLRPAATISHIVALSGGEVLTKNYVNDEFVSEGVLLLLLDVSADILDLNNSQKLMERLQEEILITEFLLKTIGDNYNAAPIQNREAYTRSEAYLIEYRQLLGQIGILETKLDREKTMPESMYAAQRVEDIEKEISQARLAFSLWRNNSLIETSTNLKTLSGEKETIERHLSTLDRNIKNATIRAPISGKINEIRALNIGDNVLSGEQIINIIPIDSSMLKAEIHVDPAYIALVKVGQKATLRFPGLPPSKYGKLDARISLIPADYMIGENAKPVFIVEARIDKPYLTAKNGERISLRAGIGAEGRIIVAQDKVIYMLLKKLDFISTSMEVFYDAETR